MYIKNTSDTWKQYMLDNCGYEVMTTFWEDFTIADAFGINAIKDTYKRAKNEWKDDIKYMTELSLVLNHKSWSWYEKNKSIAKVYSELWENIDQYILEKFAKDEKALSYYLKVTD